MVGHRRPAATIIQIIGRYTRLSAAAIVGDNRCGCVRRSSVGDGDNRLEDGCTSHSSACTKVPQGVTVSVSTPRVALDRARDHAA